MDPKKKRKALDLEILHRVPRLRAFRKRHFFVPMRRFFVEKKGLNKKKERERENWRGEGLERVENHGTPIRNPVSLFL